MRRLYRILGHAYFQHREVFDAFDVRLYSLTQLPLTSDPAGRDTHAGAFRQNVPHIRFDARQCHVYSFTFLVAEFAFEFVIVLHLYKQNMIFKL